MPKLRVEALPSGDDGRLLVRLNHAHRGGIERYGIARLSNNENRCSPYVLMLGHDRNDAIFMPYDIRQALGAAKGGELDFTVDKAGLCGKLRWYVGSPDPAVFIPTWIAIGALGLTVIGTLLGAISLIP